MPRTSLGRLCCRFGLSSVGAFVLFFGLVASGQRGGDTFFSNPWLTLPMLAAVGLAIAAAAAGLVAVLRRSERGWSVFVITAAGLLIGAFSAAELLFPH